MHNNATDYEGPKRTHEILNGWLILVAIGLIFILIRCILAIVSRTVSVDEDKNANVIDIEENNSEVRINK